MADPTTITSQVPATVGAGPAAGNVGATDITPAMGASAKQFITTEKATTAIAVTVPNQSTGFCICDPTTNNTGSGAQDPFKRVKSTMPSMTGVIVQADPANTFPIEVGYGPFTFGNGLSLSAGDSRKFPVADANMLYCCTNQNGQKLRFSVE